MRLLIDEMWPAALAAELRRRGHDAVGVLERPDLVHQGDVVVLEVAAREGRVVFTENVSDFIPLAMNAMASGDPVPGLLLTANSAWPRGHPRTLGRVVTALDEYVAARPEEDALHGLIEWLPQTE